MAVDLKLVGLGALAAGVGWLVLSAPTQEELEEQAALFPVGTVFLFRAVNPPVVTSRETITAELDANHRTLNIEFADGRVFEIASITVQQIADRVAQWEAQGGTVVVLSP